ncbi:MAG: protein-L-isoaspartate O-methyltransferase, partial [Candidatus Omnitrophica bacterium]|nr:protein-L-isoaspartate O-methyltransferase [Candidatus Omnitrophota bacterium]
MKKSTRVLFISFLIFLIGSQFDYLKAADSLSDKRREMVETQIKKRGIQDKAALEAMLSVPRHKFVPPA